MVGSWDFDSITHMKLLCILLVVCPLCACSGEPASVDDRSGMAQESWKAVATYQNPSLADEGKAAHEALTKALDAKGIHAIAAGSRGFTLSVAESQLEQAREIVRDTIESGELEAQLVE